MRMWAAAVVLFVAVVDNCHSQTTECFFRCPNASWWCIPRSYICDGFDDCGDGSDEINCGAKTTVCSGFQCANGQCIPASWECNGINDCGDDSDESHCATVCSGFQCANGQCINEDWECDVYDDCGDNSDESHCGRICKAYLDPHIVTFAKQYDHYAYQGVGNYSLSQIGNSSDPAWAVYSTFVSCGEPVKDDVSCVDAVTFKIDEHTIITIEHETGGNKIQVNGADYIVPGTTPTIVIVNSNVYPVMAWRTSSTSRCLHLLGSYGIMVRFCSGEYKGTNSVYVWASPSMGEQQLEGLCGDYIIDEFIARYGQTWPWSKDPPEAFGSSWEVSQTRFVNDGRSNIVKRQTQNRCDSNSSELADFQTRCNSTVVAGFPNGTQGEVLALIGACVYDLCHVSDPTAWLKAVEQVVEQQVAIREITINLTSVIELSTVTPPLTHSSSTPATDCSEPVPQKLCQKKRNKSVARRTCITPELLIATLPGGCACCKNCKRRRSCRRKNGYCVTKLDPVNNTTNCLNNGDRIKKKGCIGRGCFCCIPSTQT